MILARLITARRRLRLSGAHELAALADRFINRIEAGQPDHLYARWTGDLERAAERSADVHFRAMEAVAVRYGAIAMEVDLGNE